MSLVHFSDHVNKVQSLKIEWLSVSLALLSKNLALYGASDGQKINATNRSIKQLRSVDQLQ